MRALLPPRNRSPSGRKSPRAEHACFAPTAGKVHVRNMRALRPRYRLTRKSARGKDFRRLRIRRVKSAPCEKVHVRNMRALLLRYRRARKSAVAFGLRTAPRGPTARGELAEVRVIMPRYLSGPCLPAGKFRTESFRPPVFRTERFCGPPALARRRPLLLSSERGPCRSALKIGFCQ